jgi:hypothetical protein
MKQNIKPKQITNKERYGWVPGTWDYADSFWDAMRFDVVARPQAYVRIKDLEI